MNWALTSLLCSLVLGVSSNKLAPKVMLINMFIDEAEVWYDIPEFNVLAQNITIPGLSPLFPQIHCTKEGDICQIITGEGEINAASSISALVYSSRLDLTSTYFMIAGIAGVNPKVATIGSVALARYAVQLDLEFEIDAREMPSDFPTGYFAQGTTAPGQYPSTIYGTEVFEVNENLRQAAFDLAKVADPQLNDTADSQANREQYASFGTAVTSPPTVVLCDSATANTFWTGDLLGEAFENVTHLFSNGSATYCVTQQEDNATLNALLRGTLAKLVDFSRIIIMRSASDFDRPPQNETALANLLGDTPGFEPSILNLHIAGVKIVEGIIAGWDSVFKCGIKPANYVGDIFGSLGGEPDFGLGRMGPIPL
ncbi:purine nucleoside permease [Mycena maculata]|uniref:Purine nucleoside permease n=1 Tax=Mycena maculata TaxID=230809 RepID=A0AAD7HC87_9AGAR|nr:purine nucleoside permease [Mycena maculata]